MARRAGQTRPQGGRAGRGALPEPAPGAGDAMRSSWPATSSTPATRCRSSTRWCGRSRPTAPRSPRPPRRSGIPGRPTTRRPPRWSAPGWKGWCRPGPGRAARTSSPGRSSPGPSSSWPPTRRCARRSWPARSRSPSACACTPARSSERWPAAGSATPKAADLPAREMRKEEHPSLSLRPSPGRAAAEPGARPDAGQATAPGGGLDARYEQLRHAALHARAEAFPLGFGVLTGKGVTAWRHALASLAPAGPGTAAPAASRPAPAPPTPPRSRPRWPPS